ncbi:hypothetical protein DY000_02059438 [Brassica cretica]|uniref:K Homology domain-containing protein n=1 Tax=Brassica cretica TaxID=69181 RepID=A0ABQ7AW28_BRACR|nr:hypothetical protein DY000_02059438 [Brassica cretica]
MKSRIYGFCKRKETKKIKKNIGEKVTCEFFFDEANNEEILASGGVTAKSFREKLYIVHRKQLKGKETQNQARMMINLKSHKALLLSSGGAKVREIGRHVELDLRLIPGITGAVEKTKEIV